MNDVIRLVSPVYKSTRVLHVEDQKDGTGELNRKLRTFKLLL